MRQPENSQNSNNHQICSISRYIKLKKLTCRRTAMSTEMEYQLPRAICPLFLVLETYIAVFVELGPLPLPQREMPFQPN